MNEPVNDGSVTLEVSILGRDYKVACKQGERAALLEAVAMLDQRMREIRETGRVAGVERIAVMAALNIANELLRERKKVHSRQPGNVDAPDLQRRIQDMMSAIDRTLAGQEKLF